MKRIAPLALALFTGVLATTAAALPTVGRSPEVSGAASVTSIAGDGIRTHDVQLGKLAFYH